MYYRNAQSALVVYDLTKPSSLIKAKHWVSELQRQASPGIVIALVGNKLDLCSTGEEVELDQDEALDNTNDVEEGDARKVTFKEAKDYAEEEGLLLFETSAKDGTGVQEVFTAIANAIPETQLKGSRAPGATGGSGRGRDESRVNLNVNAAATGSKDGCAC